MARVHAPRVVTGVAYESCAGVGVVCQVIADTAGNYLTTRPDVELAVVARFVDSALPFPAGIHAASVHLGPEAFDLLGCQGGDRLCFGHRCRSAERINASGADSRNRVERGHQYMTPKFGRFFRIDLKKTWFLGVMYWCLRFTRERRCQSKPTSFARFPWIRSSSRGPSCGQSIGSPSSIWNCGTRWPNRVSSIPSACGRPCGGRAVTRWWTASIGTRRLATCGCRRCLAS